MEQAVAEEKLTHLDEVASACVLSLRASEALFSSFFVTFVPRQFRRKSRSVIMSRRAC